MRAFVACLLLLSLLILAGQHALAQTVDPAFRVAALIKAKDNPGVWPDSVGPCRLFPNTDVNKNGRKEFFALMDLPTSYTGTANVWVLWYEATSNDTYTLLWSGHPPGRNLGGYSWPDMTVADMDNDGNEEVIIGVPRTRGSTDSNAVKLFVYEYDQLLTNFPSEPTMSSDLNIVGRRYTTTSVNAADLDGDGETELVFTSRRDDFGTFGNDNNRSTLIYRLVGDVGPFSSLEMEWADTSGTATRGGYVFSGRVVDFDRDGHLEIWVATWDMFSMAIYEADGKDTYVLRADINQALADDIGEHNGFRFFDANGDGKLEMYLSGMSGVGSPPSAVYSIGGSDDVSLLTLADVYRTSPFVDAIGLGCFYDALGGFCGADVGDVDGDGKMDFICGTSGWRGNSAVFRLEYQSGPLIDPASYAFGAIYTVDPTDTLAYLDQVAVGDDLDGDGKGEVLIGNVVPGPGGDHPAVIILESAGAVSVGGTDVLPGRYALGQNYPNPFNPSTTIEFALAGAGYVSLRVHDVLGREVATLVSEDLQAGTHRRVLDAANLPSGTYYYTLRTQDFSDTKRMVVLK